MHPDGDGTHARGVVAPPALDAYDDPETPEGSERRDAVQPQRLPPYVLDATGRMNPS